MSEVFPPRVEIRLVPRFGKTLNFPIQQCPLTIYPIFLQRLLSPLTDAGLIVSSELDTELIREIYSSYCIPVCLQSPYFVYSHSELCTAIPSLIFTSK